MDNSQKKISWAFFGSSHFSVLVLNKLEELGVVPNLVVTTPDKPRGRGLEITPGEVRAWADARSIPVFAPNTLKTDETMVSLKTFGEFDVFLVASYGKIIPKNIIDLPQHGTLNIHPSLLPKFRGPTPLESAILDITATDGELATGVTIMQIDEQVDHGPIVDQVVVPISDWPPYYADLEKILAEEGAALFAEILPEWITGAVAGQEQEHSLATFTKKFEKADSQIDPTDAGSAEMNLRKIRAFSGKNSAFYIEEKTGKRVIVTRAKIENGALILERVKPEGKNEMNFEDYKRGLKD